MIEIISIVGKSERYKCVSTWPGRMKNKSDHIPQFKAEGQKVLLKSGPSRVHTWPVRLLKEVEKAQWVAEDVDKLQACLFLLFQSFRLQQWLSLNKQFQKI